MGAVTIAAALIAMLLTSVGYYIVIPFAYDLKETFNAKVTDPQALAFGAQFYYIIGIFPILFFGAIAISAWQQTTNEANANTFG